MITIEITPNPDALKFMVGQTIMESGTVEYTNPSEAKNEPMISELFEVEGVISVFVGENFVTTRKFSSADWKTIEDPVKEILTKHLAAGTASVKVEIQEGEGFGALEGTSVPDDNEIIQKIKEFLDATIRPQVALDGGDIIFHSFVDGVLYLELHGSCSGCPSSLMTLQFGIERLMNHYIPEVERVEAI